MTTRAAPRERQADPALDVEEAMKLLGIGRTALYDLIKSGQLRTFKIGRLRKVRASAIDDFMRRREAAEA